MTTKDKIALRKLSLLDLARDLDNVSKACKIMEPKSDPGWHSREK